MERLPAEYLDGMKKQLGAEYDAFVQSFSDSVQYTLRVNTAKVKPEEYQVIRSQTLKPVPWINNGFYYEDACNPAKHPHYYAGLYYLQEPSAMTPASRLPVEPGDKVLDLCAAPGGKATELGAKLKGEGFLLANDISNSRAKALLKNLELLGIPNVFVTSEAPEKLVGYYGESFDKILLDAPCSGEGMFRKEPRMAEYWVEHGPEYYAPIQAELTEQAYQMLKPGGMLLYSTCTFSVRENEEIIAQLMERHPDMRLMEIEPYYEGFSKGYAIDGYEELKRCVHIYPHHMRGEGHFLALLRKDDNINGELVAVSTESADTAMHKESKQSVKKSADHSSAMKSLLPREAEEFLSHTSFDFSKGYFYQQKDQIYYLNNRMEVQKGLRYLRTGLLIGTMAKNRFEPSQALAMALKKEEFDAVLDLSGDDERVIRYLKGETLDVSDFPMEKNSSWQLVCVDGFPLGWGKRTGGNLKNKYYAGWRWQ